MSSTLLAPPKLLVDIVSINVALPEVIGTRRGEQVLSAIKKRPLPAGQSLLLTSENLAGDRQADLTVHGGPDKAVYAYPSEHFEPWTNDLRPEKPFGPGSFGENITTSGWLESDVRIGDLWRWGTATLQVCQPRYPCFKLALATERLLVVKRMLETLRNGWYLRVLEPGVVHTDGQIEVIERGEPEATVRDAVMAVLPGAPRELTERFASMSELARSWRHMANDALRMR